jgi:hypothetical protein
MALHSTVEAEPQALTLSLMLPPVAHPQPSQAAAEPASGSCVIVIDLA